MRNINVLELAKQKANEAKDYGIKIDTVKSAKSYLYIFHNLKNV